MELAIQRLAIVSFMVIGLSHILKPRIWAEFFIELRNKGETGSFLNAFIHLPLGALIVGFHNVWVGIPMILTLLGYGLVLKSLIYFVFPRRGLKTMSRVSLERSWEFIAAGMLQVIISILLTFSVISGN